MTITVTKTFEDEAAAAAWLAGTKPAASTTKDAAADKPAKAEKPTKAEKPAGPEHSREEMVAAINALAAKFGKPAAKEIIQSAGKAEKLAEIPEDKIDAVYAAVKAKMESPDDDM
jgi:hypothetical protein